MFVITLMRTGTQLEYYSNQKLRVCSAELGREPRVHTVANLTRLIGYNNKDNMTAGLIVGGYDPYKGGQVYTLPE